MQEVYKWKAKLKLDGSKQVHGVHFWDTYALSAFLPWSSIPIDYVQAYAQADVEKDNVYMNVIKGFDLTNRANAKDWDLHTRKNVYGGKAVNRVWSKWRAERLARAGFHQSEVNECVYIYKRCIYVYYIDDSILAGPDPKDGGSFGPDQG